ncbi:hypothetical protein UG55_103218 [Frankia sp. EI5c]|nr:hypothetical protein UG55_103218 [Frankia sp. EI5c]
MCPLSSEGFDPSATLVVKALRAGHGKPYRRENATLAPASETLASAPRNASHHCQIADGNRTENGPAPGNHATTAGSARPRQCVGGGAQLPLPALSRRIRIDFEVGVLLRFAVLSNGTRTLVSGK